MPKTNFSTKPHVQNRSLPSSRSIVTTSPSYDDPRTQVFNEFGSLQAGDYCVKNGRTTRVTAGICNGSKAYCNWKFDERYNPSGVVMATEATEEFIIVTEESQLDARWWWRNSDRETKVILLFDIRRSPSYSVHVEVWEEVFRQPTGVITRSFVADQRVASGPASRF